MMIKRAVLWALFIVISQTLVADQLDLRGFVFGKEDGQPVEGAYVTITELSLSVYTNKDGIYSFNKIEEGTYTITITSINTDPLSERVEVKGVKVMNKNFYLQPASRDLGAFEMIGKKTIKGDSNKIYIGQTEITPAKDFSRLPMIGGEPDMVQYLQILPGVVSTGDQGGQLFIRGGSPVMNKVLLDGMTIYNPFHSIGLYSVFDPDLTKSVNVLSAGFNSQYGGRISAVLDVQTKDANKKRTSGKISMSPFASRFMLEGPLKPYVAGEGSATYMISYKNSFLDKTAPIIYPNAGKEQGGLPFSFSDFYSKLAFNSATGSKLGLFFFNFNDHVRYPNTTQYGWKSTGGGLNFLFLPEGNSSIINGTVAYTNYLMQQIEADQKPRNSEVSGFNAAINFTYFLKTDELKYGMEINGFKTNFQTFNAADRKVEQEEYTTELCGFVKYRFRKKRWVLEPGVRSQYYASLGNFSFEPRFSGKYDITSDWRVKAAGGLYTQNLIAATSDRDVVNLFYGFLSGPDYLQDSFAGQKFNSQYRLQASRHAVLGTEYDLGYFSKIEIEGYFKGFTQLVNINRDKVFEDIEKNQGKPEYQRKDFIVEKGLAKGIDFKYHYERKGWFIWLVYSLTYVNRYDGIRTYFPSFDRRHNGNAVVSYQLIHKKVKYYFNARWNIGSGFPFTQTQGFYEFLNLKQGISTDYTKANGTLGIQYAEINQGRLPYYHRLDLSIERKQMITKRQQLSISLSVTNAYNRSNIFYFDRVNYKRINQLPIMPALAMNYSF
jgi:hypothetical protein